MMSAIVATITPEQKYLQFYYKNDVLDECKRIYCLGYTNISVQIVSEKAFRPAPTPP